ncbi:phospholipid-binding protein [Lyngbya aestuarii]|uniref:phospholipid-binding protein n=1 Tax=Lyngbya aestuarii TaxID=118322 RepID=UPI00403D9DC7
MGWLQRLFGKEASEKAQASKKTTTSPTKAAPAATSTEQIAPERVGLEGEYDQSGLAKRVALAFDQDNELNDEGRLWVAQTGSTVVLKGEVASQQILDKMVTVAKSVKGCTGVETDQVAVG